MVGAAVDQHWPCAYKPHGGGRGDVCMRRQDHLVAVPGAGSAQREHEGISAIRNADDCSSAEEVAKIALKVIKVLLKNERSSFHHSTERFEELAVLYRALRDRVSVERN